MNLIRKCVAEFLGTFAIVFGGCGAVLANQLSGNGVTHAGIAITFGLIVMTMIYATGHLSGANFNPAVTFAFSLTRHFPKQEILPYMTAQSLGAIAASMIHKHTLTSVFSSRISGTTMNYGVTLPIDGQFSTALIWEFLLTFFLMFVIMAVATDYRAIGHASGVAIGGTVAFEAMFAGPICGASMNPARSLGPALISGEWSNFTAYVLGPLLGAIAGALVYEFVRCHPKEKTEVKGCC